MCFWKGVNMSFIELLKVILLGIVEGITEWLPISSTGHMILVDEFIKLNVSDAFMEFFLPGFVKFGVFTFEKNIFIIKILV